METGNFDLFARVFDGSRRSGERALTTALTRDFCYQREVVAS
jgi:hypothetical protein